MKTKVAVCGALAAVLGFIGTISTPLCRGLPVKWQAICILGGTAAQSGAEAIKASMPDAGN